MLFKKLSLLALILLLFLLPMIGTGEEAISTAVLSNELQLPESLEVIEAKAFYRNTSLNNVIIPEGTLRIDTHAFAYSSLTEIELPASLTFIAEDAFEGCGDFLAVVHINTLAHQWCESHNIRYRLLNNTPVVYRALLIGNTYEGTDSPLVCCDDDVVAIRRMLSLQKNTPYSFTTKLNLTAPQILSAITTAFSAADDNDVSLFFFSGHGSGSNSESYMGALCGNDWSKVTVSELRKQLDTIPGKKIVLLNSCHSGAYIGKAANSDPARKFNDSVISAFSDRAKGNLTTSDYTVLTACAANELCWNSCWADGYGYGWFTHGITRGSGYDMINRSYCDMYADNLGNRDGNISLYEAYTSAYDTVISIYQEKSKSNTSITLQNVQYHGNPDSVLWSYGEYSISAPSSTPTPTPTPIPTPSPTPAPQFSYTLTADLTAVITDVQPVSAQNIDIPVKLKGYTVSAIQEGTFRDMKQLESVEFPVGVSSIGDEAFKNCSALTQITLHPFIKELGSGIFDGCNNLTVTVYEGTLGETYCQENNYPYVSIPNPYEGIILEGTRMIEYTGTAEKLVIPEGITTVATNCFLNADTLEEIIFPDSLEEMEEFIFGWMINLKRVELKGSLTTLPNNTFTTIVTLEEVVLPDTIQEIGEQAFYNCSRLNKINMPANLRTIGDYAFFNCPSLREVVLPHGLQNIGHYAFTIYEDFLDGSEWIEHLNGRYGLDKIFIPSSVTSMGDHIFDDNRNLVAEVESGSYALSYCQSFKIPYRIVTAAK